MVHRDYDSSETYDKFTVTVDQIEEWLGLNFFTNLPEDLQTKAENNSSWSTFASFR